MNTYFKIYETFELLKFVTILNKTLILGRNKICKYCLKSLNKVNYSSFFFLSFPSVCIVLETRSTQLAKLGSL